MAATWASAPGRYRSEVTRVTNAFGAAIGAAREAPAGEGGCGGSGKRCKFEFLAFIHSLYVSVKFLPINKRVAAPKARPGRGMRIEDGGLRLLRGCLSVLDSIHVLPTRHYTSMAPNEHSGRRAQDMREKSAELHSRKASEQIPPRTSWAGETRARRDGRPARQARPSALVLRGEERECAGRDVTYYYRT